MKRHPPGVSILRARQMRKEPTEAEAALWRMLRESFPGCRFRRQVPIRHYVVDFASHRAKLVIEADGGQHGPEVDGRRDEIIRADGYMILRFWNNDVLDNPDGVHARIAAVLAERLTPTE